jgi:hypothetical protein
MSFRWWVIRCNAGAGSRLPEFGSKSSRRVRSLKSEFHLGQVRIFRQCSLQFKGDLFGAIRLIVAYKS